MIHFQVGVMYSCKKKQRVAVLTPRWHATHTYQGIFSTSTIHFSLTECFCKRRTRNLGKSRMKYHTPIFLIWITYPKPELGWFLFSNSNIAPYLRLCYVFLNTSLVVFFHLHSLIISKYIVSPFFRKFYSKKWGL